MLNKLFTSFAAKNTGLLTAIVNEQGAIAGLVSPTMTVAAMGIDDQRCRETTMPRSEAILATKADIQVMPWYRLPFGPSASLTKQSIRELLACVDTDKYSYALSGVCIRDGLACATDGKILREISHGGDEDLSVIVPCDALKVSLKLCGKNPVIITTTHILAGDYTLKYQPIDGTYPPCKNAIPTKGQVMKTNTTAYLKNFAAYVETCVSDDEGQYFNDTKERLVYMISRFQSEYSHNITPNGLASYLAGLAFDFDFSNCDILKAYEKLHGEPCPPSKHNAIIGQWFSHLAIMLERLAHKSNLSFYEK